MSVTGVRFVWAPTFPDVFHRNRRARTRSWKKKNHPIRVAPERPPCNSIVSAAAAKNTDNNGAASEIKRETAVVLLYVRRLASPPIENYENVFHFVLPSE